MYGRFKVCTYACAYIDSAIPTIGSMVCMLDLKLSEAIHTDNHRLEEEQSYFDLENTIPTPRLTVLCQKLREDV
jgi:hypothetical protein